MAERTPPADPYLEMKTIITLANNNEATTCDLPPSKRRSAAVAASDYAEAIPTSFEGLYEIFSEQKEHTVTDALTQTVAVLERRIQ